jgi:hypothetical protein
VAVGENVNDLGDERPEGAANSVEKHSAEKNRRKTNTTKHRENQQCGKTQRAENPRKTNTTKHREKHNCLTENTIDY